MLYILAQKVQKVQSGMDKWCKQSVLTARSSWALAAQQEVLECVRQVTDLLSTHALSGIILSIPWDVMSIFDVYTTLKCICS